MDEPRVIETERGDGVDCPNFVRAFVAQQVKGVDIDRRSITHLVTTDSVDRQGDIVEPGGANLDHYRKNPIVMVDHNYRVGSVVGRARQLEVGKESIVATTEFRDTPVALEAFALAREGLGGWSIGFRPKKRHSIRDGNEAGCERCKQEWAKATRGKKPGDPVALYGMHFTEWEMLEYSIVAVPANQDIVNDAVRRGLVSADRCGMFFRCESPRPSADAAQGPNAEASGMAHPAFAAGLGFANRKFAASRLTEAIESALEKMK